MSSLLQFVVAIVAVTGGMVVFAQSAFADSQTTQVSTGYDSACAVVGGTAKCWGSNEAGKLGIGKDVGTIKTTPVTVVNNKSAIPAGPTVCTSSFLGICTSSGPSTPAVPASPLGGKYIEKISVGRSHACALAAARVYCWGDNSHGQLGNHSTTSSATPVPVAINEAIPAGPTVCKSSFLGICTSSGPSTPAQPASSLRQKEVIDISAGEYFTCVLASDGSVSCWGEGDDGRLGTNKTNDFHYPVAVYSQGALAGKRGIRLAKASESTMCVLVINTRDAASAMGNPYCWGKGIGDGALSADTTVTTACDKNAPVVKPSGRSTDTIYQSLQPVAISTSQLFSLADANGYVTGLAADGKAYYWGMYGHRATESYSDLRECRVNPCTGKVSIMEMYKVTLARETRAGFNPSNRNQAAYSNSRGLRVTPAVRDSAQANTGGGNACTPVTHYGYTKKTHYNQIGQRTPTAPPANSLTQSKVTALSGEVFSDDVSRGLYCAAKTDGTVGCDSNGTSSSEGQTGSDYTPRCTTTSFLFFTTTTCDPAPIGPQPVVMNGWLAGKSVTALSTGKTGYTCAIASGAVGCWGINDKGQLGVGDTVNRRVPAGVGL